MTREEAKEICRKRMLSGIQFTFAQLDGHLYRACGGVDKVEGRIRWRIADGMIQQFRKKGLINFVRHGREIIWHLTDEGKRYAEDNHDPH